MNELLINTSNKKNITIIVKNKEKKTAVNIKTDLNQSELLLKNIDKILRSKNIELSNIGRITANSKGDSYTSLRIGIITVNALIYGCNLNKTELIVPQYSIKPIAT